MSDTRDIVERLRTDVLWHQRRGNETIAADCQEAADEITRLRADLATSMETAAKGIAALSEAVNERAAAAVVPQGWALVPVEPTPAMVRAGTGWGSARNTWAHMLAAAPHPAQTEGGIGPNVAGNRPPSGGPG